MKYKFYVVGDGSEGPQARPVRARADEQLAESRLHPARGQLIPVAGPDVAHARRSTISIVYQLHVGTFFGPNRETRPAKFLDVLDRIEYLADLGVNAIEPLPIVEYSTPRSLGYNGTDLFSPEMDYQVARTASWMTTCRASTGCSSRKARRPSRRTC